MSCSNWPLCSTIAHSWISQAERRQSIPTIAASGPRGHRLRVRTGHIHTYCTARRQAPAPAHAHAHAPPWGAPASPDLVAHNKIAPPPASAGLAAASDTALAPVAHLPARRVVYLPACPRLELAADCYRSTQRQRTLARDSSSHASQHSLTAPAATPTLLTLTPPSCPTYIALVASCHPLRCS
ncbi:hypothetical protein T440DRAFT_119721 [Plenodomus tracheiphilus IPT5]|uniref:Uncharacterized protein n=1 Tax=Plenodomus tracheiphilus IPT5 TaxID=1408161 RepID=A0A6A7B333_9PLEO|nr:hypothetical protein T440DRAFT_119721 [Plenodomus tracheiphilus IPT5]